MKAVAVWADALPGEGLLTWETELRAVLRTKIGAEDKGQKSPSDSCAQKAGVLGHLGSSGVKKNPTHFHV